jgi:hypothetical protein
VEKAIGEVQAAGGSEVYVEILAKPGQRVKKAGGDAAEAASDKE